ncbi:hypothetical protein [Streptomyces sp. NPDC055189]
MRRDDEAAGEASAASPARNPQPAEQMRALGAPVPGESLREMDTENARRARRLQENLDRRMADERMVRMLSADGFAGPRYDRFEEELARYGISVLRGWMHSGFVFKLVALRGFDLRPDELELEELVRDGELREELAMMTVARALPAFRQRALVEGGWRAEGGAGVATYFMGACAYEFPNEYRRYRRQEKRWRRGQVSEDVTTEARSAVRCVEEAVLSNLWVLDELKSIGDPRIQAAVALTVDDFSQEEIQQLLDAKSIRAVEGMLYRWRMKKQREEGGRHG